MVVVVFSVTSDTKNPAPAPQSPSTRQVGVRQYDAAYDVTPPHDLPTVRSMFLLHA
jgi:hypothetical protein